MFVRFCLGLFLVVLLLPAQSGRGGRGGGPGTAMPGQPQPPPPAADCAASGTVVNSITGATISHAMVSLSGGDAAGSATDATGKWSILNTTCGTRRITASHLGFIPGNMYQGSAASRPTIVQLVSGSPVTDEKISLTPEASLSGKVQDTDGEPLQAQVQIFRVNVQAGKRVLNGGGGSSTDAQGNFRIGGLTGGRYIVCATSRQATYPVGGGAGLVYGESCFPGPLSAGLATAMPIEAGREGRTDFTLTPIRGAHVRGSIQGVPAWEPGKPRVNVQLAKSDGVGGGGGASVQSGRDGTTFDVAGVAPGSYVLRATLPGSQGESPTTTTQAIEVGDSDINDLVVTMQSPGSLSGTVRFELSNPAAGANFVLDVNLAPAVTGANFAGPIPRAQWDANHVNFDFAAVPVGEFRFNANSNAAPQGVYVRSATLRGQDVLNQPFTVNGVTGPIDVVVSDDTGGIDVTTNDADGHPVTASVILVAASGMRRFLNSGDDGHAVQKTFPVGEYKAWAFDDLNVPYAEDEWMTQNAGPGEKVIVTSGGAANVTLKRIAVPAE